LRANRIEQLAARHEHDARARDGEHPAHPTGVDFEIETAALHGAECDGVDHQPGLPARLK